LGTVKRWLSDTPLVPSDSIDEKGYGVLLLATQYILVDDFRAVTRGKRPFWVFTVHFPLDENVKTKNCKALIEQITVIAGKDSPVILTGDFNFFSKKQGAEQRKMFIDAGFQDALERMVYVTDGRAANTTWWGDETDPFKNDLENPIPDVLDGVFVRGFHPAAFAVVYDKTMLATEPEKSRQNYDYPSDHFPVVVSLRY